jgi:hypothetical protein
MSITDLSKRREKLGRRADDILRGAPRRWWRYAEPCPTGRAAGIAWAKKPENGSRLSNLRSHFGGWEGGWKWELYEDLPDGPHMLLYVLTCPQPDGDEPIDEQWLGLGLERPVAEAVADLATVIGEEDLRGILSSDSYRGGWITGAVDYSDSLRRVQHERG